MKMMVSSRAVLGVLGGLLALTGPAAAQAENCPNLVGVIIGCIFATAAVVILAAVGIIFCLRRRAKKQKPKAATKTGDGGLEQAHVNPAFQDDGATETKPTAETNDVNFAEQGFGGYTPCKEFDSTKQKEAARSPLRSNGNLGKAASQPESVLPTHGFGTKLTKTGSHGSLDDSYPSLAVHSSAIELSKMRSMQGGGPSDQHSFSDPEVINVPLQSQDIIGLGFNIYGNLRDGIFVSQVHNRGPASESRLIKPGDRILGITISFENMVYEDALTILSYASPYPVKLQVQKKMQKVSDPDVTGEDYEEALHLHHPIYRSQSMDDVSKIAQESVFRMRRARSEMKRGSSKRKQEEDEVIVEPRLRKWSGKPGFEEPVVTEDVANNEKSDNSTVSIPDLQIDTSEVLSNSDNAEETTEATVHQWFDSAKQGTEDPDVDVDVISLEEVTLKQTEAPTLGLSPKRQAEADRKEGLRLSYEADQPVPKLELGETVGLEEQNPEIDDDIVDIDHLQLAPLKSFSTEGRDSQRSQTSSRRSPSPVVLTGDMGLDLKIGTTFTENPESVQYVPDVGEEVAVGSESGDDPTVAIVTEHDGFLDIDLKDMPAPPPSPPTGLPPPLGDENSADVTDGSMLVLVNEESILTREKLPEQAADPEEDGKQSDVHAVLTDYFADQPSLMERLGLTKSALADSAVEQDGDVPEVKLAKRLSSDTKPTGHEPLLDIHKENDKILQEAKAAIRRRSSSSEEGLHASSPSTLSSRSSSPTEHQQAEAPTTVELEDPENKAKSHSPLVTKRSTGGLVYEISPTDFQEMAVDVPADLKSQHPPAGVAYYVAIDDDFQGVPPMLRAAEGGLEGEPDEEHPSLVKAWDLPGLSPAPRFNLDHVEDVPATSKQINEVVTIETVSTGDGSGPIITETRTSTIAVSNNNNESGMNGKGGDSPPLKSTKEVVTTEVSKSNEVITVTRHEEIQGAYTVSMNTSSSHNDDSEA